MTEIPLKCDCGKVLGVASHVTARSGTRVVCHCDDCQAFARYLDQEDQVLDQYGGTDIFQMPMAHVKIAEGFEQISCLRLSPKGLFRWYTDCCKTPIGNTLAAGMPFVGVIHNFMDDAGCRDENLGPVNSYLHTKCAKTLPADPNHAAVPVRVLIRIFSKLMIWKLKGLNKPSSFFDSNDQPVAEPFIVEPEIEN